MIYLFVFNYFCFRVHYLLTSAVDDLPCELLRRRKALFYHAAADLLYVSYRLLSLGPLAKGAVIGMFT